MSAVDFGAIPEAVAEALTISEFAAEVLISTVVILVIVAATAIFTQEPIVLIIMTLLGITVDIAFGWLDYFFLVFACLIVALLYSNQIKNLITGGG